MSEDTMDPLYFLDLENSLIKFLLMDLVVAVFLIAIFRFVSGFVMKAKLSQYLSEPTNPAAAIGVAGGILALAILLSGILGGRYMPMMYQEFLVVVGYGVVGMGFLRLGRSIQDRLVLTGVNLASQIQAGNIAAALVEAANIIGTALIIRASLLWVEGDSVMAVPAVFFGFIISQLLVALVARYRFTIYAARSEGRHSLETGFANGNKALALRYVGHVIGVSLAVTSSSYLVTYANDSLMWSVLVWLLFSLVMMMVLSFAAFLARKVILMGIDTVEAVDQKQDIGVAAMEAAIFLAMGVLLATLMS